MFGTAARIHYKHIGLYVYRRDFLLQYSDLPVGPLEQAERLEQLRALENGYRIRVVETEYESLGVDTPEDLERVSAIVRSITTEVRSDGMAKYIFVTGGVVSSLGKGIAAASIGCLLESRGLRVTLQKFDPYLNVDPGTMSPFQHGEVFVTDDGAETDLDLGHYERFTHAPLTQANNLTSGRIYEQIIQRERRGDYLGKTVQVIPHVTNEIKAAARKVAPDVDVVIVEIGGTVGDIESLPFLEAIRQMRHELGRENTLFVHVTLVPWIAAAQELKTKPTQHSVKELRAIGIQPDMLLCRSERALPHGNEGEDRAVLRRGRGGGDHGQRRAARSTKCRWCSPSRAWTRSCCGCCRWTSPRERDLSRWTGMLERMQNPRGRSRHRAGRQVRRVRGFLQEPEGGAAARRRWRTG